MSETCLLEAAQAAAPPAQPVLALPPDDARLDTPQRLAPGVFFLKGRTIYFEAGAAAGPAGAIRSLMCNNGWVDLGDSVLLVDSNMPGRANALLAAVRATTDKPIRFVVNTHHHGDHIYGNRPIYERTGASIIGCAEMVEELRRHETGAFGGAPGRREQVAKLRPDVAATPLMVPTVLFDRRLVIEEPARRVELLHLGWGHTRGDTAVWLPSERILFAGDLVANGPYNIVRDGEMLSWPKVLAKLENLNPAIVIPGHGECGAASLLTSQRTFLEALLREVRARTAVGATLADLLAGLDDIRAALLADPGAREHVIPSVADLPVLALAAQVERVFGQLGSEQP